MMTLHNKINNTHCIITIKGTSQRTEVTKKKIQNLYYNRSSMTADPKGRHNVQKGKSLIPIHKQYLTYEKEK